MNLNQTSKKIALTVLLTTCAFGFEKQEIELDQAFGALVVRDMEQHREGTPSPSPTPPTTPTSWEGLETALLTSPYYTSFTMNNVAARCDGTKTVPLFVANLKAIEEAGAAKAAILKDQLGFVNSTWLTWSVWTAQQGDFTPFWCPRRYPLIYKFLVNRATACPPEQSQKRWYDCLWLLCGKEKNQ